MIQFRNICKNYGSKFVLNNISFTIDKGEVFVLLGPSGCGKSTTIKLINKLLVPDSGQIFINNEDIALINDLDLRKKIGYVIQNVGLFPHMNVEQNIAIVPKLLRLDKDKIHKKVEYLLEFVGLDVQEFIHKYPNQLSGGEAQRVGVARALAGNPEIILMDEPFGALDPVNRYKLQREFLKIKKKLDKTIVFVTHDIEEAILLGDKIAIMDDGKIIQTGSPDEIVFHPKSSFISSFLRGEGALLLLSKYKIGEMNLNENTNSLNLPKLSNENSLKEALAKILETGSDYVATEDKIISLSQILEKARMEKLNED
ncbi:MAG: ABC transporter ATP-binding protein [Fusobacteria bacterium]|nr:ABC transporter ATP-binding protein [Fusobacteriota bacterium]